MKTPAFWNAAEPGYRQNLLAPIGNVYGNITARRMQRPGQKVGCPVICVGNFTAGGTGKTPAVLALSNLFKPYFGTIMALTRGYGGMAKAPFLVDPKRHSFEAAGDEALLLARVMPVIVAKDRLAGARLALDQGADLILMDDGFQNPHLHKDFSLIVVDAKTGFGNGHCLPAGPLRAPLSAQIPFADAFLVMGEGVVPELFDTGKPVFRGSFEVEPNPALLQKPLLVFAGLGRPEKVFDSLRSLGADVRQAVSFADHHAYTKKDIARLEAMTRADDLRLVTTQKDFMRLKDRYPAFVASLVIAEGRTVFDDPEGLETLLLRRLTASQENG